MPDHRVPKPAPPHGARPPQRANFLQRFQEIDFGEDDANLEYEVSQLTDGDPIFIKAFYNHPQLKFAEFRNGRRYIILGQKGTGKTAILRRLQKEIESEGGLTQFMIFRDEVASKEELDRFGQVFSVSVNDVRKVHYHFYTLERLLLLILSSKLETANAAAAEEEQAANGPQDKPGGLRSLVSSIVGKPLQRVVEVALQTVSDVADVVDVNASKLTKGAIEIDNSILLRKMNERLLNVCVKALAKSGKRVVVFVDEIHFTYRTGQDHDQDAGLVRDLIRAVSRLNRAFREQEANCLFYAAIRSEFLDHPLISAAELHPIISTYGTEVSWSTFSAGFEHPMFEIGALRVDANSTNRMNGREFMHACFANFTKDDAIDFVQSTWSKPRDMIRFLRTCKDMFPNKTTLNKSEYNQVFHRSCVSARKEIETALTSFLTNHGVERIMTLLSDNSSKSMEQGNIGPISSFLKNLSPIVKQETQIGSMKQPESLFRLLYMLGAIYTMRPVPGQKLPIMHSFHRGQSNPDPNGMVAIHKAIAKSYS